MPVITSPAATARAASHVSRHVSSNVARRSSSHDGGPALTALALAFALTFAVPAVAAEAMEAAPPAATADTERAAAPEAAAQNQPPDADDDGLRRRLKEAGVATRLSLTGDLAANTRGGLRRGSGAATLARGEVDLDLDTIAGWRGATFHAIFMLAGGNGFSDHMVGGVAPFSNIFTRPGGYLGEVYLLQSLADDAWSVKLGKIAIDGDFFGAESGDLFINETFGWPALNGSALPGGGAVYPLSSPGARIAWKPAEAITLQFAALSGSPLDRRGRMRNGLNLHMNRGALLIAEGRYDTVTAGGLKGVWKLGGWYNSARFDDLRLDHGGAPLAADDAGPPHALRGNHTLYAVADQTLWRDADSGAQVSAFARVFASHAVGPNPLDLYIDGGVVAKGLLPGRADDAAGVAVAWARASKDARQHDRDIAYFSGEPRPARSSELVIEATYRAALSAGLSVQPFVQATVRPGAGAPDPSRPWLRIRDSVVVGLRSAASF